MRANKTFKIFQMVFLSSVLFLIAALGTIIGLILHFNQVITNDFWIEPPTVATTTSLNSNNYIHSFLGSPFEQYTIYSSKTQPKSGSDFSKANFNGNLANYKNIVNDEYEISLWNDDFDLFQFVIQAKSNLNSLQIAIDNEQAMNEMGLNFEYGLNDYIYSSDKAYPENGIWTPDKLTTQKVIENVKENQIFSFVFKVNLEKNNKVLVDHFNIKTTVVAKTNEVYEQLNRVQINLVSKDYSDLIEANNQLNFLTNDQRLTRYYLKTDLQTDPMFATWTDADWNNEEKYVDYIWNNYLTTIYQKLAKQTDMPYYTTFIGNITRTTVNDHKTFTWDWNSNDPTLLTWHVRKKPDGTSEFYLPIDEQLAWKKNMEYALKAGFNKIFLRGLDGVKYDKNPKASDQQLKVTANMKFIDDDKKDNQAVFLATSPFNNTYFSEYNISSKDLTSHILKTTMNLINEIDPSLTNDAIFYWYYDENDQRDYDLNIQLLNQLKAQNSNYQKFKTAYAIIYDALDLTDPILLNTDLIYLHHYSFNGLNDSPLWQKFLDQRQTQGLKTSQYTMDSSLFQILGYEPGINAFWMNWTAYYGMNGLLHYAMTSWTKDSSWTSDYNDNSEVETGEITFLYPNEQDHNQTFVSYRLALYQFGYRLNLKQQVLHTKTYYNNFVQANWTREKMSSSKFDFKQINENNYSVSPTSSWKFLNWIYEQQNKSFDVNIKLKNNYRLVNHL